MTPYSIGRYDMRRARAEQLIGAIMQKVGHLVEDGRQEEVYYLLHELLSQGGIEVLSDYDRQRIGLPPRGPDGWTVEEIMALEQRRLDAILTPVVASMPTYDPNLGAAANNPPPEAKRP
ncbi:hypothetical protein [Allomesorhizobium alhagi]|uniref:Uncharacterized protein n=1 Tax=Mesorhizobium alhagi CCNWXJ12-2 TaxID=1107882 RepID=H0HNL8_9HYPH|nr:hypothetical protein [Mesorhizobium alhagi]EHK57671.1 hypothetical protein MAXJ12_08704 [Mesorhizobium alhagi CCNWXJ12-2]